MADMSPVDWALRPMQKYATFRGRAPRAEYWWFYLATLILSLLVAGIEAAAGVGDIVSNIISLILFVPTLAVLIRRLHDTDRSGWWLMIAIVPLLVTGGLIVKALSDGQTAETGLFSAALVPLIVTGIAAIAIFIFTILPGTHGPNRFGADPYGADNVEEVFR